MTETLSSKGGERIVVTNTLNVEVSLETGARSLNTDDTISSKISIAHSISDSNDLHLCVINYEKEMATETKKMDVHVLSHFVFLMLAEKDKGLLHSNSFTKQQFAAFSQELYIRCGIFYPEQWLRKKYHRLRTMWFLYRDLRENYTGVGHDPQTGAILASDEQWETWIKNNELYRQFRNKSVPHYGELTQLFMTTTASGDFGCNAGDVSANSDEERDIELDFRGHQFTFRFGKEAQFGPNASVNPAEVGGSSRTEGKRPFESGGTTPNRSSKKFKSRGEIVEFALETWANNQLTIGKNIEDTVSVTECMTILKSMGITDLDLYIKTTQYFRDPTSRVIFKMADPEFRLALILSAFP